RPPRRLPSFPTRRSPDLAADTDRLGRLVGQCSQRGAIVALYGDLGTGKTVFVRGVASGLGASPRAVSSPTFVLIHEYQGQWPLADRKSTRLNSSHEWISY